MKRSFAVFLLLALFCDPAAAQEKGFMSFFKKEDKKSQVSAAAPASPAVENKKTQAAAPPKDMKAHNLSALVMRMANNKSMTDAEKTGLAEAALKFIPADADVKDAAHETDTLRFEQIVNDPNMKTDEKKKELQAYFSQPRPAAAPVVEESPAAAPVVEEPPAAAEPIPAAEVLEGAGAAQEDPAPVEEVQVFEEPAKKPFNFAKKK